MSDGQPRAEWIFPEEKKSNKGRIWLIVGLSVLALAIVGTLLFFLLPRDGEPTPSPSPSASSSATASPSPTSAPTPTSTPTSEPVPTQPPAADPDMDTFVGKVQPRLDDGVRGLQLVQDNMDLGAQIVDSLQNDAAVLSDTPAPSSLAADWSDAVSQYASRLGDLRAAYDNGSDPQAPLDAASAALQKVRALVGL
ncbi:hypothetical protein [Microbacterium sp. Bi121]|uniref:hypothetical protein n=1 Tax=Microbacterium sp. Bi121 TaxID=2822348 RepID=UPI001DA27DF2|nr:hypothetical protein [Microbacterium sp. Bi121]CAH0133946.1 hypothetical protein SRABI121_00843 [Microbacterium sp. Bi121]